MLQDLCDESRQIGVKMNIAKTKLMAIDNVLTENVEFYVNLGQHYNLKESNQHKDLAHTTKNHGRLGCVRHPPALLQNQPRHLPEETGVQLMCAASYDVWCRDSDTNQNKHSTNVQPHRPKWKEVCSTSHARTEGPTSGS